MKKYQTVGNFLRDALKEKRFTQEFVGELLGYKRGQVISNCCRGVAAIPRKDVAKLCNVLGVEVEQYIDAYLADKRNQLCQLMTDGK